MELEFVISEVTLVGPVAILGVCNAHLSRHEGQRGVGEMNLQGVLLQEVIDLGVGLVRSLWGACLGVRVLHTVEQMPAQRWTISLWMNKFLHHYHLVTLIT